jgi:hypothetical protein
VSSLADTQINEDKGTPGWFLSAAPGYCKPLRKPGKGRLRCHQGLSLSLGDPTVQKPQNKPDDYLVPSLAIDTALLHGHHCSDALRELG